MFKRLYSIIKKEIKNTFYILISIVFYIFDTFTIKKKNIIVFAQKNNLYSDNSRAFFEYINDNDNDFKAIWLVHNIETLKKIRSKNISAELVLLFSLKGLKTLLFAKTVVTSNSLHDFFPYFKPSFRKEAIQLWHGIKWSKKFEYPNNNFTEQLTIICASSDAHKEMIYKQNLLTPDKVFITGLPRNDIFFNQTKKDIKKKFFHNFNNFDKKIILYAPTHKEDLISSFFPFSDLKIHEIEEFLVQNNFNLYLRPHINDTNKNKLWKKYIKSLKSENIISLSFNELEDINSFLPIVDILITDYSTIYTDAILFEIPTIFIPYDYLDYKKKRGFVYDFNKVAVGPKVSNQKQLINEIKNIDNNRLKYVDNQNEIKKLFHNYQDGNSSKRILDILNSNISYKNV